MRMPRHVLIEEGTSQVFHVVSRVVDRRVIFEDLERDTFLIMMRKLEAFSGVEILSYCLMGNHFHLLLHVPRKPEEISVEEVRKRMKSLYSDQKMAAIDAEIEAMREQGNTFHEADLYERMRARMFDMASFMKDLKLRFSKWFNTRNERKGTLWEDRYRSSLVEPTKLALTRTAAYIELNPVRAGLVDQPHDYRWCSYTEAVAGNGKARQGIKKLMCALGPIGKFKWDEASRLYRSYFIWKGATQTGNRKGFTEEDGNQAIHQEPQLKPSEILRTKIRYFTDGVAIGSKEYLEEFLEKRRDKIGNHRKKAGYKMKAEQCEGLHAYRDVRD